MFTQVNKGENPAPASLLTRQVRTMSTPVNEGENPAPRISSNKAGENHVHASERR